MSEFNNVTAITSANIYFDGNLTSRTIVFPNGSKKKLGIMLPREYELDIADKEIMDILSGELDVLLPDEEGWQAIKGGESFEVPANSKFRLNITTITDF